MSACSMRKTAAAAKLILGVSQPIAVTLPAMPSTTLPSRLLALITMATVATLTIAALAPQAYARTLVAANAPPTAARPRLAVLVTGEAADECARILEKAAQSRAEVAAAKQVRAALKAGGVAEPSADALRKGKGRAELLPRLRKIAGEQKLDLLLVGHAQKSKRGYELWLLVLQVSSGKVLSDGAVEIVVKEAGRRSRKPPTYDGTAAEKELALALDKAAENATASTTAATAGASGQNGTAAATRSASASGATTAGAAGSSPAAASAGGAGALAAAGDRRFDPGNNATRALVTVRPAYVLAGRKLAFAGDAGQVRGYSGWGISRLGFDAEAYPGAPFFNDWRGDVGLGLGLHGAVGLASQVEQNGQTVDLDTTWLDFLLDVRLRWPYADALFVPRLGYGISRFAISSPDGTLLEQQIPTIDYRYVRAGIDARYPAGPVTLLAGVGLRYVFDAGGLGDGFFGTAQGLALDAAAGAALKVHQFVEVQVLGSWAGTFEILGSPKSSQYSSSLGVDNQLQLLVGTLLYY